MTSRDTEITSAPTARRVRTQGIDVLSPEVARRGRICHPDSGYSAMLLVLPGRGKEKARRLPDLGNGFTPKRRVGGVAITGGTPWLLLLGDDDLDGGRRLVAERFPVDVDALDDGAVGGPVDDLVFRGLRLMEAEGQGFHLSSPWAFAGEIRFHSNGPGRAQSSGNCHQKLRSENALAHAGRRGNPPPYKMPVPPPAFTTMLPGAQATGKTVGERTNL